VEVLNSMSIPYVVGGSLASSYHGLPRSQADRIDREYLANWAAQLQVNDLLERALSSPWLT
jgi:hypothetical protein